MFAIGVLVWCGLTVWRVSGRGGGGWGLGWGLGLGLGMRLGFPRAAEGGRHVAVVSSWYIIELLHILFGMNEKGDRKKCIPLNTIFQLQR